MIKKLILIAVVAFGFTLTAPLLTKPAVAAPVLVGQIADQEDFTILPRFGGENSRGVESVIKYVFGALSIIALIFIAVGGLKYALSGGDSNAIASAKNTILYAVIGLVLGLLVYVITSFIIAKLS